MNETEGIVTALDGEYALVKTEDQGCGRCSESGGCGGVRVSQMLCSTSRQWRVLNPRGAQPGEKVRIAIDGGAIGASVLLIYVQPLLLFFTGVFLGSALAGESGALIGAAAGLLVSWRWVVWRQQQRRSDRRFMPRIV